MKFIDIKETGTIAEFKLIDADISTANAIRRILLAEYPVYAIDEVDIIYNTSIFPVEMICHRLGLIPIDTTQPINFELKVECTTPETIKTVRCTDIQLSTTNDCFPYNVPILKLKYGQKIHLKGTITEGIAKTHAKYCFVHTAMYSYDKNEETPSTFQFKIEFIYKHPKNKIIDVLKRIIEILINKLKNIPEKIL